MGETFRRDYSSPLSSPQSSTYPGQTKYSYTTRIYNEVIKISKEKIKIGVYERSNSSYRSKWFCVLKKDGKSLGIIVHDLQPLNAVTIQDLGTPPILDFYADNLGDRGSYMGLDLFVALTTEAWQLNRGTL